MSSTQDWPRLTVLIPPELFAAIDALAGADDRKRSPMVRTLLREALAARQRRRRRPGGPQAEGDK